MKELNLIKMKFNNLYSLIILAVIFLTSCDGFKQQTIPIDIPVDDVPSIIVFNGEIEKGQLAWVQISYSEDIDSPANTPIKYEENATITLETNSGEQELLVYTINGYYLGNTIYGHVNESYTITIDIDGVIFRASATMLAGSGFQDAWVTPLYNESKDGSSSYSEEWIINDPANSRNRYLFEWYTNGSHIISRDWAIDDNRVVNVNNGLRLTNPTIDPGSNEYTVIKVAEIEKVTYDYFNMYEKIMRGLAGANSQTPFNPVSNFGLGTMGNFRAVAFSSGVILTPPDLQSEGGNAEVKLIFPLNEYFTSYNLYWSEEEGVTEESNVIFDIDISTSENDGSFLHDNLDYGESYYYRMQVEDNTGNLSILSPELVAVADTTSNSVEPNVPGNVTAIASIGEITISWTTVSGGTNYFIAWEKQPGVTLNSNVIFEENLTSPYIHSDLISGVTYYYKVGVKVNNTNYLSEEVSATVY